MMNRPFSRHSIVVGLITMVSVCFIPSSITKELGTSFSENSNRWNYVRIGFVNTVMNT
jgi:hypothetical protein